MYYGLLNHYENSEHHCLMKRGVVGITFVVLHYQELPHSPENGLTLWWLAFTGNGTSWHADLSQVVLAVSLSPSRSRRVSGSGELRNPTIICYYYHYY